MIKKIIIWLKGFLVIYVYGLSRERFVNLCIKNNLNIWNIRDKNNYKEFYVSRKSYKELKPFIEKTGVDLKIHNKRGLPYLFYRYKKRKIFILCVFLFIAILYSFSFFIWNINITGENIYTDEQILKVLKSHNVDLGTPIGKIDCSELEKALRDDFDDIAWISCEINGTSLNININETIPADSIKENTKPCNIVAVKDGLITDIYVKSGTRVADKGIEVKKGDILITGAVYLYNDYDELIETTYVPANGEIYAIVSYDYDESFDMSFYEKEYTGNQKKYYGISLTNNTFYPIKLKSKYNNYDIIEYDNKIKLGSKFYLPISIKKKTIKEYQPVLKSYSKKEAENKAYVKLNTYIDELNKKGVEILENNVKIEIDDGICRTHGTIVTKELIGVPADITIINQGEEVTDGTY